MPDIRISPAIRREHEASAKAMLGVEALALRHLSLTVQRATAGKRPIDAAKALQEPVARAVEDIRAAGRRAGSARFRAELGAAGLRSIAVPLPAMRETDRIRAERAAAGLAAVYLVAAEDGSGAFWNHPKVRDRIELDAATETAVAFNDERADIERALRERNKEADWLPALLKQWNASNDKRLCPRCAALDGKIRPIGFDFAGGAEPGRVHPRCRCFSALIFVPLYLGQNEQEAA